MQTVDESIVAYLYSENIKKALEKIGLTYYSIAYNSGGLKL